MRKENFMKKLLLKLFILCLISATPVSAVTYFTYWVNGSPSNTLVQGDLLAWEADVATPGNTLTLHFYIDLDGNHVVSSGDKLLEVFMLGDGEPSDGGPADSSTVPDGILYVDFGPFGFAPQSYVMLVEDEDGSSLTTWFSISEMSNPPATVSGHITLEGITPPDTSYENIMIAAMGMGMFSGLTDASGAYTINLISSEQPWQIGPFFTSMIHGFVAPEGIQFIITSGDTTGIDFYFQKAKAWVYGQIQDESGVLIPVNDGIALQNFDTNDYSGGPVTDGEFLLPVAFPDGDTTAQFTIEYYGENLLPDYMIPAQSEPFTVNMGDSLEKNLTAFATDAVIYGYVTENGQPPNSSYKIVSYTDIFGTSISYSDSSGYLELPVRSGSLYWAYISTDPWDGTPLPEGWVVENGNSHTVFPGDTLYFNIIPAGNLISGQVLFDEGDPVPQVFDFGNVTARDTSWTDWYQAEIDSGFYYYLPLLDGTYNVSLDVWSGDYLTFPNEYVNVTVQQDTIDSLNFIANYAHADLTVKLVDAPIPQWFDGYGISTVGEWPFVYAQWENLPGDTTFHFRVCEGNWLISVPFTDPDYVISRSDTVVVVSDTDSSYYVEFVYTNITGLESPAGVPNKLYLKQNYPNPFNPTTQIEYGLARAGRVEISVYNMIGEKIATLVNDYRKAGKYTVEWNAEGFASGVYIYRFETDGFLQSKKFILLK